MGGGNANWDVVGAQGRAKSVILSLSIESKVIEPKRIDTTAFQLFPISLYFQDRCVYEYVAKL